MRRFLVMAAAIALVATPGVGVEMHLDSDGMAVVDGQRTFVLGLYENPSDDAALKGAVEAGINLVHASASKEALDRLQHAGAWGWLNTGYDIDLSEDADAKRERLAAMVQDFAGHPALLVWEVPDEALWNAWYMSEMWRLVEEPKAQRAAVDALEDAALAATLKADLAAVRAFYNRAQHAEGEALADTVWTALGKDIPRPGYGLSTAPERAPKLGEGMVGGHRALRALDPKHPVWMNHAPRNTIEDLAFFNRGADIVGCDIYPVPVSPLVGHSDLANKTLACVGAYTDRMQAAAPGKPVWMVLQGTGWGDFQEGLTDENRALLRRPTKNETRFMAYDAIVHGARGLLYWGSHYVEKDSDFWRELLEVIAELDSLQGVLSAPDAVSPAITIGPSSGSLDRTIAIRSKSTADGDWHVLVNEYERALAVTLSGLAGNYRVYGEDTPLAVADGAATVHVTSYSVCLLQPVP